MQGRFLTWPCALRAKPTQASALTHDSNLSEKSPGNEQRVAYGFGTADATHMAACWKTTLEIVVWVLDGKSKGDSTRLVGNCGHPWHELGRGLLNGIFQS